jgi:hypothetical protein
MNRTTISLTPKHAAALRKLAAALGLYLPRPLGSQTGNLSALLAAVARTYLQVPPETQAALAKLLRPAAHTTAPQNQDDRATEGMP